MPWGRLTLKRSLAPGAAPGGTSTVCAAPLGMRHLDAAIGEITMERAALVIVPALRRSACSAGSAKGAARGQWLWSGSASERGPSKRGPTLDAQRHMSLAPSLWLGGTVISITHDRSRSRAQAKSTI